MLLCLICVDTHLEALKNKVNNMKKKLLICGVGSGMSKSIKEIVDLGVSLIVITDKVDYNIKKYADKVIVCYPRSIEEVRNSIIKNKIKRIDGIMTLGYENLPVIADIAKFFKIKNISMRTALNCTHKNLRTPLLAKGGIRVPRFEIAGDILSAKIAIEKIGYPCVIKPNDKTSSIGVAKISNKKDALILIKNALDISESHTVIIEEYLKGTEHTVEGIVNNKKVIITGISDRNYSEKEKFYPYFYENGDTLPSSLDNNTIKLLSDIVNKGILVLKLNNVGFHCDVLITKTKEIFILEIAGRIAGSRFGTELVPLSTGVRILPNIARMALGWSINYDEIRAKYERPVVLRYLPSMDGEVVGKGNLANVRHLPGVYDVIWEQNFKVGSKIRCFKSGKDVLASVIATGDTLFEAEAKAVLAIKSIPVIIK